MSTDNQQLNDALAANYMLVDIQIRSWGATATDQAASDEVRKLKGANPKAGKFVTNLLAGADAELTEVRQLASSIRDFVYGNTLPWSNNLDGAKRGSRLVDARNIMGFLKELNGRVQEHNAAVVRLQAVWQQRIQEALVNLGGLGDLSKYPTAADIPNKFSVAVDVRPVPSMHDFKRVGIPAELAEALAARQAEQDQVLAQNALDDLKGRILEELQRMAKQLAKAGRGEKTRLYDSLVTNMQGLVALARSMNMRNSPELAALADRIERELLAHPVEVYRNSTDAAAEVAQAASKLAVDAAIEEIWK